MMYGTGPLGLKPAGQFNFEPPPPGTALYLEQTPKRIRVIIGGETVADSRRAMLLQESGLQPVYYFPPEDVRSDLLESTDKHTHCPKKGDASYYTIRVGDRVVKNGAWYYPEPLDGAPPIEDLIAFYWDKVDTWMEEDEEVIGHARDPYHRIDTRKTSRHIRISRDGQLLAETTRACRAVRVEPPDPLVHPAGGRRGRARAERHGHDLPVQGPRRLLLGSPRERRADRGPRLVLRRARSPRRSPSPECSASTTRRSTSSSTASCRSGPELARRAHGQGPSRQPQPAGH